MIFSLQDFKQKRWSLEPSSCQFIIMLQSDEERDGHDRGPCKNMSLLVLSELYNFYHDLLSDQAPLYQNVEWSNRVCCRTSSAAETVAMDCNDRRIHKYVNYLIGQNFVGKSGRKFDELLKVSFNEKSCLTNFHLMSQLKMQAKLAQN